MHATLMQRSILESQPAVVSHLTMGVWTSSRMQGKQFEKLLLQHGMNKLQQMPLHPGRLFISVSMVPPEMHDIHALHYLNGIIYCDVFGGWKLHRCKSLKYAWVGKPADRGILRQIRRLSAGRYPLSNGLWPNGAGPDLIFRSDRIYRNCDQIIPVTDSPLH